MDVPKKDADAEHLLIEAHIFRKIAMTPECIKRVTISRGECPPGSAITANAAAFSARAGIPVVYIT